MLQKIEMGTWRTSDGRGGPSLLVKLRDGLASVRLGQIEYVAYRDHALTFVLVDGREIRSRILKGSFARVSDESLSDARFVRPHESYVVNMDHVQSMTANEFEMRSGTTVPISKRAYQRVREEFVRYMVGEHRERIL